MLKFHAFGLLLVSSIIAGCGGGSPDTGSADTVPDQFAFTDRSDVPVAQLVESDTVTISGMDAAAVVSITGGEYSINRSAFTSASGEVDAGDSVVVRQVSSVNHSTSTHAMLTVGGVSDTFTVTTQTAPASVADTIPDVFSLSDVTEAAPSSTVTSNLVVISGINAPAPVSIINGLYSINGGAFVAVDAAVNDGDSVAVQLLASSDYDSTTQATLMIGGVSDTFSVTTQALPNLPQDFALPPLDPGDASFTSAHFSGSQNCALCHDGISDGSGADVSIVSDWGSSMMANAARDPLWRAKVSSELKRNPALAAIINDKCTRCHAPMANEEMQRTGEVIDILGSGLLDSGHARHDETMEGVSCTLCHQITDRAELGTLDGISGQFEINDSKTLYGPYIDIQAQPMINNTGYTPAYSAHVRESKLCASCHNLKTPYVDEFGNLLSQTAADEFPEQMPYSEWLHSDFAARQSCQDCHMSRADGVVMSTRPPSLSTRRDNFGVHDFIGANRLMLDIFANNKIRLGVLSNNFAETIAKTENMLASAASVSIVNPLVVNGVLEFAVDIVSHTGHKLPTSFPSRRLIVHVTVRDAADNILFESGRVNVDGSVEGVDADDDRTRFEAHHELITEPGQVQVYETVMGNNLGEVNYTLLRASHYLKDNRLLPSGFDKRSAADDIAVRGAAASDADFTAGGDRVNYRVDGLAGSGYQIEVELVYQTLAFAFAQDLFRDDTDETNDFRLMYNNSNAKSTVIATTAVTLP